MIRPRTLLIDLRVRTKLAVLGAILVLGYAAAIAFQLVTLDRFKVGGPIYAKLRVQTDSVDALGELIGDVNLVQATVRSITAKPDDDEIRQVRAKLDDLVEAIEVLFGKVERLQADEGAVSIADAQTTWRQFVPPLRDQLQPGPAFDRLAFTAFLDGTQQRRYVRLTAELSDVLSSLRLRTDRLERTTASDVQRLKLVLAISGIGVALVLVVTFVLIGLSITRPLNALVRLAEQVGGGNLAAELPEPAGDELGQVAASLGRMVTQLRLMVGALRESSDRVADATERMRTVASEQLVGVRRQVSALQETQATTDELRQTSRMASQRAGLLRNTAEEASAMGRAGSAALDASRSGIETIKAAMEELGARIGGLDARARVLARVSGAIKDINDQTNMVALNAKLAAVRAGDHGREFSAVATQIRALTNRAAESTQQIGIELQATEQVIREAVGAANRTRTGMDVGLREIETGAGSLQKLAALVEDSNSGVRDIATAVGQQDHAIAQISTAITELGGTVSQTELNNMQIEQSVKLLEGAIEKLRASAATFRV